MRWAVWIASCVAVDFAHAAFKPNYDAHDYYAVHLRSEIKPEDVSEHLGLHYEGPLGELEDHHVFRTTVRDFHNDHIKSAINDLKLRRKKREAGAEQPHMLDNILLSQKQELHKRFPLVKRQAPPEDAIPEANKDELLAGIEIATTLGIKDPEFQGQWHLHNPIQVGHDINVTGVWLQGITGKNTTVCFVDDGLDMDSDDLRDNYFAAGSWDFNDPGPDPKPRLSDDRHGTRCAGEVAAVRNDVCGVGIAYDGKVSGLRILSKVISDADEAVAMTYAYQENQIYSCSWGPPDDGQSMEKPGILIQRSMLNGIQKGRSGLGSIYVFAIGNGAGNDDNCNFDGYTNSIYSVSVGGIDREGHHPYYSEACSAQLVVTYSSGAGDAIHTTDVGKNACYDSHGGTSAAGPLVAGMYALMLEVNPSLTWRDIQWITVLTAVKVEQPGFDWALNEAVNKEFSHQFGYGKADAYALVEMARGWQNVKPQAWFFSPWLSVQHDVPQGDQGLASHFTVTQEMLTEANLARLEHVTVTMNVAHTRRGDLSVELISPSGMVSHVATARRNDNAAEGYRDWTFMSVAHWGESGVGEWTVIVKDTNENEHSGTFTDWRLRLWGESIDAERSTLLPMPTEHEDDHEAETATETASVKTTSVAVPTETGMPEGNPDDHIDRPVNSKTAQTAEATETVPVPVASPTDTTESLPSSTASFTEPTPVAQPDEGDEKENEPEPEPEADTEHDTEHDINPSEDVDGEKENESTSSSSSNFLPHPFPTFGVSKTTQVWIYGAIALILTFLVGLGAWWYYMRRKQRRINRDDYGFEMVDHDDHDDEDANGFVNGRRRRKKRAGELYDAFAEGTDDEEGEPFELGEDSDEDEAGARDEKRYRDTVPLKEGKDVQ